MAIVEAEILDNGDIVVKNRSEAKKLYEEGYGLISNDILRLSGVEAAYLVFKNIVRVNYKGQELNIQQLFKLLEKRNPELPLIFTVYQDLRSRGRIVKPGFRNNTLFLHTKGLKKPADRIVYIVGEESTEFSMNELLKWVSEAYKVGKEPVLAIVDKHGDVTYYEIKHIELKKKPEEHLAF